MCMTLFVLVVMASLLRHDASEASNRLRGSAPDSAVERYGQLRVEGNKLVSAKTSNPVRLRGMSMFWSQWKPQFWTNTTVQWLRDNWNVSLVRAAMAVENAGYLDNPEVEKARVKTLVDSAIALGIYVIIDWHDHNAEQHLRQSKAFFDEMASTYGAHPNVLFEVFNEPMRQEWATAIKPYHEQLVKVIRQHSDNVIILGTRLWSQEVDVASKDPVIGRNLAYTLHFYADTHREELREKVSQALTSGIAIFATEWGTCDATGDGKLDFAETQRWLDFLSRHDISDANWAVHDKKEACAALKPGASGSGGWPPCALTESGAFVRAQLRNEPPAEALKAANTPASQCSGLRHAHDGPCSDSAADCTRTRCCTDLSLQCYQKNEFWAGCRATCTPGIDPQDPPQYQVPWTCTPLS